MFWKPSFFKSRRDAHACYPHSILFPFPMITLETSPNAGFFRILTACRTNTQKGQPTIMNATTRWNKRLKNTVFFLSNYLTRKEIATIPETSHRGSCPGSQPLQLLVNVPVPEQPGILQSAPLPPQHPLLLMLRALPLPALIPQLHVPAQAPLLHSVSLLP